MEYFLGSIFGVLITLILRVFWVPYKNSKFINIKYTQTSVFEMVKFSLYNNLITKELDTQATRLSNKDKLRVLIVDHKAYWIKDNAVFVADLIDGDLDKNSAKIVDTMNMDRVELDHISFIVDTLTRGDNNDRSNPGYKKF